jgi:hypothetical protein
MCYRSLMTIPQKLKKTPLSKGNKNNLILDSFERSDLLLIESIDCRNIQ